VTAVFAIVLVVGLCGLISWIAAVAIAENVAGWERVDPERRFGATGRRIVAATVGFGMAGISASFAGWPWWGTAGAAVVGAAVLALLAGVFGPES
jgi:hypothetical protein